MRQEEGKERMPDRLLIAFQQEYESRNPGGYDIPIELQEMFERHLMWARTMGAESVIHKLQRTLELTSHLNGKINFKFLMELIRTTEPGRSTDYLVNTPRIYEIHIDPLTLNHKQKRTLKP